MILNSAEVLHSLIGLTAFLSVLVFIACQDRPGSIGSVGAQVLASVTYVAAGLAALFLSSNGVLPIDWAAVLATPNASAYLVGTVIGLVAGMGGHFMSHFFGD